MKIPISIVRGTTKNLRVSIEDTDGTPYVLTEGEILRLGVIADSRGGCPVFWKEVDYTAKDGDAYIITIIPGDTANLNCNKQYYYDIGLQTGENYYNIIELSPFTILPNASRIR